MSDDLEKEIALYEAERNRAWHSWFANRGDVSPSDEHTRIFDGGFRMAWELCRAQPAPQPAEQQPDVAQLVEALEACDTALFCDLKTDEEKSTFFLSGRGYETGVIAHSIQNDVATAYQRCSEYRKEAEALQAENEKLRDIVSDINDWHFGVGGGFLSIPVSLWRRMQDAIDAALAAHRKGGES